MVGCILIFAFVFNSLSSLIGTIYTATKKTSVLFYSTLAAACVNIALNIILIPCYGLYGAAFATLVSYVCVWLIRALLAKKQMEKGFIDRNSLIILVLIAFQIVIELSSLEYKMFLSFVIVLLVIAAAYKKLRNCRKYYREMHSRCKVESANRAMYSCCRYRSNVSGSNLLSAGNYH